MMVSHRLKVDQRNLVGGGFQFLKAKHIRLILTNPLKQSLADGRADAVYVIADDLQTLIAKRQ